MAWTKCLTGLSTSGSGGSTSGRSGAGRGGGAAHTATNGSVSGDSAQRLSAVPGTTRAAVSQKISWTWLLLNPRGPEPGVAAILLGHRSSGGFNRGLLARGWSDAELAPAWGDVQKLWASA